MPSMHTIHNPRVYIFKTEKNLFDIIVKKTATEIHIKESAAVLRGGYFFWVSITTFQFFHFIFIMFCNAIVYQYASCNDQSKINKVEQVA